MNLKEELKILFGGIVIGLWIATFVFIGACELGYKSVIRL